MRLCVIAKSWWCWRRYETQWYWSVSVWIRSVLVVRICIGDVGVTMVIVDGKYVDSSIVGYGWCCNVSFGGRYRGLQVNIGKFWCALSWNVIFLWWWWW